MRFFVDTANLGQIEEAMEMGIIDGVTTNPSLMAKEGIKGKRKVLNHYKAIAELVEGRDVSAEVLATDFEGMIKEGEKYAALAENIVVKVPMIKEGLKAINYFYMAGIRTNCTLIFSAGQALLAANAGADFVSPFIGRIDDIGWDGLSLIEEIADLFTTHEIPTEVLAASIRNPLHIVKSAMLGADVATCPLSAIESLLYHPLTDKGLAKFMADAKKMG